MNRSAFLRTTVAMAVSAQYGQGSASFGVEPSAAPFLGDDLRWSDAEIAAMGPRRPLQFNVIRGELGRIDSGVRIIGFDLASEPDRTVHAVHGPDGSWAMVVPADPAVEWDRALRTATRERQFDAMVALQAKLTPEQRLAFAEQAVRWQGLTLEDERALVRALRGEG
jgi:hypothetical protein